MSNQETEWGWCRSDATGRVALVCEGRPMAIFPDIYHAKEWFWWAGLKLRFLEKLGKIEEGYDATLEAIVILETRGKRDASACREVEGFGLGHQGEVG